MSSQCTEDGRVRRLPLTELPQMRIWDHIHLLHGFVQHPLLFLMLPLVSEPPPDQDLGSHHLLHSFYAAPTAAASAACRTTSIPGLPKPFPGVQNHSRSSRTTPGTPKPFPEDPEPFQELQNHPRSSRAIPGAPEPFQGLQNHPRNSRTIPRGSRIIPRGSVLGSEDSEVDLFL